LDTLDEIVAGLTAGGEVVAAGGFTLDRAHALRKLEQYQMRDPALAVARLVEAAALLGGSLRAFASPWGLQFLLHRVYLSRREAEDLLLHALEPGRSLRSRALGELAVGLLAAARDARRVTFTSCDTEGAYRLAFADDHTATITPLPEPWRPTSVDIVRFLLPLPLHYRKPEELRELDVLRVLAHWSTADVFIADERVSLGLPRQYLARREVHDTGVRGVIGLRHPKEQTRVDAFARYSNANACTLHLLSNGIHIEAFALPGVPSAIGLALDLQDLNKDVAHEHVVRDATFEARLQWLCDRLVDYGAWLDAQRPTLPSYGPARLDRIVAALQRPLGIDLVESIPADQGLGVYRPSNG
jgi:hypothetical protein